MTEAEAQELLILELTPGLSKFGFSPARPWSFAKRVAEDAVQTLSFGVKTRASGGFSFGCGVGVRFDGVEQIIGRSDDNPAKTTFGMPIHLLREGGVFEEWYFSRVQNIELLAPEVIREVAQYAMPFLEKYSSLGTVRAALESAPRNWFGLGPEGRIKVLTGIVFVQEGREQALRFLNASLDDSSTKPPLRKGDLLVLRRKMTEC